MKKQKVITYEEYYLKFWVYWRRNDYCFVHNTVCVEVG